MSLHRPQWRRFRGQAVPEPVRFCQGTGIASVLGDERRDEETAGEGRHECIDAALLDHLVRAQ